MSGLKSSNLSLSERCRALAEECRSKAHSFRNDKPRIQMFQLAADYERKAKTAEALEASLRDRYDVDASLAPINSEPCRQLSKEKSINNK